MRGREAIAAYFARALAHNPAVHFAPIAVTSGPRTVVIEYQRDGSPGERSVEVLGLDADGLIIHSRVYHAH